MRTPSRLHDGRVSRARVPAAALLAVICAAPSARAVSQEAQTRQFDVMLSAELSPDAMPNRGLGAFEARRSFEKRVSWDGTVVTPGGFVEAGLHLDSTHDYSYQLDLPMSVTVSAPKYAEPGQDIRVNTSWQLNDTPTIQATSDVDYSTDFSVAYDVGFADGSHSVTLDQDVDSEALGIPGSARFGGHIDSSDNTQSTAGRESGALLGHDNYNRTMPRTSESERFAGQEAQLDTGGPAWQASVDLLEAAGVPVPGVDVNFNAGLKVAERHSLATTMLQGYYTLDRENYSGDAADYQSVIHNSTADPDALDAPSGTSVGDTVDISMLGLGLGVNTTTEYAQQAALSLSIDPPFVDEQTIYEAEVGDAEPVDTFHREAMISSVDKSVLTEDPAFAHVSDGFSAVDLPVEIVDDVQQLSNSEDTALPISFSWEKVEPTLDTALPSNPEDELIISEDPPEGEDRHTPETFWSGTQQLQVAAGEQKVLASDAVVGDGDKQLGKYTVAGKDETTDEPSRLEVAGRITVGGNGAAGVVEVLGGAKLESDGATIGDQTPYGALVHIRGAGSTATVDGPMTFGESGQGTMLVEDGGRVATHGDAKVGLSSDGRGDATVSDPDSRWTIDGSLEVGLDGRGQVFIANGGRLENTGEASIGANPDSDGKVRVADPGSRWSIGGTLTVGDQGGGFLSVRNDSLVHAASGVSIGGNGLLYIAGGGKLSVGNDFDASVPGFVFGQSGRLRVAGDLTTSGATVNGQRTVILDGAAARWDVASQDLIVGDTAGDGGHVRAEAGGRILSRQGRLGAGSDATGTALVTGAGSEWIMSQDLSVGRFGQG